MSQAPAWRARDRLIVAIAAVSVGTGAVVVSASPTASTLVLLGGGAVAFTFLALWRFEILTLMMIAARTGIELVPSGLSSELLRISVLATGAYTVAALVWLARHRSLEKTSWLARAVGAVAAVATVSALLSEDPAQAAMGASRWIFLGVFVMVLERLVNDEEMIRKLVYAMALSMIIPLAVGASQIAGAGPSILMGETRISGSLSHSNTFGFYLVIMILALVAVARRLPTWPRRFSWVLIALAGVELAATYSRTSHAALGLGLVVLGVVGRRWGLLALTVLAVASASLVPGIADRWDDIDTDPTLRGTPGNSLAWRVEYWGDVLEASEDRRVTGLGLGVASDTTEEGREPHNDLVRAVAEIGALGLIAYVAFLAVLARRAVTALRTTSGRSLSRDIAEAVAAVAAAYLLGSLTGNLMTQLVLLWYVLSIAVAGGVPLREHRELEEPAHV